MRSRLAMVSADVEAILGRAIIERELYRKRYERVARAVCNAARAGLLSSDVVVALACGSERVFAALVDAGLMEDVG